MRELNLDTLKKGLPGITPANGNFFTEAAVFCLVAQGFKSGVSLKTEGAFEEEFRLVWTHEIDDNTYKSWVDNKVAAEFGAMGIALLLMLAFTAYAGFQRGNTGTGIDYWMTKSNLKLEPLPFFKKEARLEISGLWQETTANSIHLRVNKKKRQVKQSDKTNLPVYIVVVAFNIVKAKIIQP